MKRATLSAHRRSGRPADITYLAEVMEKIGRKPSIEIGIVLASDQGGDHFELVDGGEDLLVHVELVTGRIVTCRVMSAGGGPNQGVWAIPGPGTEVVVGVPRGRYENGGVIIGTLSTGSVPSDASNTTIVIVAPAGGQVLVHDGSGTAVPLALKSDVQAVKDAIENAAVTAGDGGAAFKTNIGLGLAGYPAGTTVLRGK